MLGRTNLRTRGELPELRILVHAVVETLTKPNGVLAGRIVALSNRVEAEINVAVAPESIESVLALHSIQSRVVLQPGIPLELATVLLHGYSVAETIEL